MIFNDYRIKSLILCRYVDLCVWSQSGVVRCKHRVYSKVYARAAVIILHEYKHQVLKKQQHSNDDHYYNFYTCKKDRLQRELYTFFMFLCVTN